MHLDPDRMARRALELAQDDELAATPLVLTPDAGFSQAQRQLVIGVMQAVCEELASMFSDGVALGLEDRGVTEEDISTPMQDLLVHDAAMPSTDFHDSFGVTGDERLEGQEADLVADLRRESPASPIEGDPEKLVDPDDRLVLQDDDATAVAGLSWTQLQRYAVGQGIDLYDRSGETPKTKSKATLLAELGIEKETT